MKIISRYFVLAAFLLSISHSVFAQGTADPAVTGANFNSDLIGVNHTSNLTVSFVNSGFTAIPVGSIQISINTPMNYVPDGITTPTGSGGELFDWVFLGGNLWRGTNNVEIGAFGGGDIVMNVTGIIPSTTYEVSNINVQPIADFNSFLDSPGNNNLQPGLKVSESVLPVEWRYFTARSVDDIHRLTWGTAQEINVNRYEIECKYPDQKEFESIGSTTPKNNATGQKEYTFDNAEISKNGVYLYRIKQIDNDGKFVYSEIRSLSVDAKEWKYNVYPNPTTNIVNIDGSFISDNEYEIHIISETGKLVRLIKNDDGEKIKSFKMEDLTDGIYYILIYENKSLVVNTKIIKV